MEPNEIQTALAVAVEEVLETMCFTGVLDSADGDLASMQVLANTLLTFGPANVLAGKLGFIDFTHDLLVNERVLLFPAAT